jgi:DNA polymerase-3 subunit alpha
LGVKVPVVAEVRNGETVRYVRLGSQFCVKDVDAAISSLRNQAFEARSSDRLVLS